MLKHLKTNFVSFKNWLLSPLYQTSFQNTLTQITTSYLSPALFQLTQPLPMIAFGGPTTLGAVLESFFFLKKNGKAYNLQSQQETTHISNLADFEVVAAKWQLRKQKLRSSWRSQVQRKKAFQWRYQTGKQCRSECLSFSSPSRNC